MLNNQEFLNIILESFKLFVESGTSRSNKKLKPLHGSIARDISERLGDGYVVKAQGFNEDKEDQINGRYYPKNVDITVLDEGSKLVIAGVDVKFVMQNYAQNSNNYFENMLGETANIRAANNSFFQVFIILDRLPYYDKDGNIKKWEVFSEHNIEKYFNLSKDNISSFFHTPNKTLLYVVGVLPVADNNSVKTKQDYLRYYSNDGISMEAINRSNLDIKKEGTVIVNDYERFIEKIFYTIMSR